MALLWVDSFDNVGSISNLGTKYPAPGSWGSGSWSATGGRRSSGGVSMLNNQINTKVLSSASGTTCISGFAWLPPDIGTDQLFSIYDNDGVEHVRITTTSSGTIRAWRGAEATLLGESAANVFNPAWGFMYVEVKATIDDSAGIVVVRINESIVLNLSSADTRNAGLASWNRVALHGRTTTWFDDWYVLDGSGASNNDFLGDCRADPHMPNANGANSGSTPSTGTDRYATVDETSPNSDTDYNTITNVGDKDTLSIANQVNAGKAIYGVVAHAFAKKTDAGAGDHCIVVRQDGVDYDGASSGANTSYGYYANHVMSTAPDGTAWTETKFNAIEVGYKRTA
jgi:hypothetical protein